MIKASELRIGNIVGFVMSENLCYVSFIGEDGFITTTGISNNKGEYNAERGEEDMMPIALTPEILESAGFGNHLNADNVTSTFTKKDKDGEAELLLDMDWRHRDMLWPMIQHDEEYIIIGIRIKYLHQLQNLYFALTGEELTVNL